LLLQWQQNHTSFNFDRRRGAVETRFFEGGRTNIAYNCLDRNIREGRGNQPCFLWEVSISRS
jgi:acetyl-CoA synthetase